MGVHRAPDGRCGRRDGRMPLLVSCPDSGRTLLSGSRALRSMASVTRASVTQVDRVRRAADIIRAFADLRRCQSLPPERSVR